MNDDARRPFRLPDATSIGQVRLRVRDLARALAFYADVLGLEARPDRNGDAALGAPAGETVLRLVEDPAARYRPQGTLGLYHVAVLLPDRASLAAALARVLDAHHPLQGFADHAVSERWIETGKMWRTDEGHNRVDKKIRRAPLPGQQNPTANSPAGANSGSLSGK